MLAKALTRWIVLSRRVSPLRTSSGSARRPSAFQEILIIPRQYGIVVEHIPCANPAGAGSFQVER